MLIPVVISAIILIYIHLTMGLNLNRRHSLFILGSITLLVTFYILNSGWPVPLSIQVRSLLLVIFIHICIAQCSLLKGLTLRYISVFLYLAISWLVMVIPFEDYIYRFDTPAEAYSYVVRNKEIVTTLEDDNCAAVLYRKDYTTAFIYLRKVEDGWLHAPPFLGPTHSTMIIKVNHDFITIEIKEFKRENKILVMATQVVWEGNNEVIENITDSKQSIFRSFEDPIDFGRTITYYAFVSAPVSKYALLLNGREYVIFRNDGESAGRSFPFAILLIPVLILLNYQLRKYNRSIYAEVLDKHYVTDFTPKPLNIRIELLFAVLLTAILFAMFNTGAYLYRFFLGLFMIPGLFQLGANIRALLDTNYIRPGLLKGELHATNLGLVKHARYARFSVYLPLLLILCLYRADLFLWGGLAGLILQTPRFAKEGK